VEVSRGAWWLGVVFALGGMLACSTPLELRMVADDVAIDRVWVALACGDLAGAERAAGLIDDADYRDRARWDLAARQLGRGAVVARCLDEGSPWAGRFLASPSAARGILEGACEDESPRPALLVEQARRSGSSSRREALARRVVGLSPGGPEGLALYIESLQQRGRWTEAALRLDDAPDTARLRLARRRLDLAAGRLDAVVRGLLDDVESGQVVPESLETLVEILSRVPFPDHEQRTLELLESQSPRGETLERTWRAVTARLGARRHLLAEAAGLMGSLEARRPVDERRRQRWLARAGEPPREPTGRLELELDARPRRVEGEALLQRRLADEWGLAARATYQGVVAGDQLELDGFAEQLDEAASHLGQVPRLGDTPRREFGFMGAMFDTAVLAERLPGALVVGGKALGLPPEITWYDLLAREDVPLPGDGGEVFLECQVTRQRIPGFAASLGARFAGAGLHHVVFIDLDQVVLEVRNTRRPLAGPPVAARPATGRAERRSLAEPLECWRRLVDATRAASGDDYEMAVLEALTIHERRHILDTQDFLKRGFFGRVGALVGAGLLPGSVRAEVERRAQLDAMRQAGDPRIPLAECVSFMPAEGRRGEGEHAQGYAALLREFLSILDRGAWEGARPLVHYGIDRERVLIQQLHLLPPEIVRAIANAVEL